MAARKMWWIKERRNPQRGTYFVGCGKMFKKDAKDHEDALYGRNIMRPYETKAEYETELSRLRQLGHQVH